MLRSISPLVSTKQGKTEGAVTAVEGQISRHEPFSPSVNNLKIYNLADAIPVADQANLCLFEDHYWLHKRSSIEPAIAHVKELVETLPNSDTLLIDFRNISPTLDVLFDFLQAIYFPESTDWLTTERFVKEKKVILINPDPGTLLGISQCLELAHTHCMVIPRLQQHPWELLYAGHIEPRLESLLKKILDRGTLTSTQLAEEENTGKKQSDLSKFTAQLRELYELGLVTREKKPVEARRQKPFQYALFHPYAYVIPDYAPAKLNFYRMPRPPRSKVNPDSDSTKEEPEPVSISLAFSKNAYPHIVAAIRKGYESGDLALAVDLSIGIWSMWDDTQQFISKEAGLEIFTMFSEVLVSLSASVATSRYSQKHDIGCLRYSKALFSPNQSADETIDIFTQCCDIGESTGDLILYTRSLVRLGMVFANINNLLQAEVYYKKGLNVAHLAGDPSEIARVHLALGNDYNTHNQYSAAFENLESAMQHARLINDKLLEARTLDQLGRVTVNQVDRTRRSQLHTDANKEKFKQAEVYFHQALTICKDSEFKRLGATILVNLSGGLDWEREKYPEITGYLPQAIATLRELGDTSAESAALLNLAACQTILGIHTAAYENLEQSLKLVLLNKTQNTRTIHYILDEFARLNEKTGYAAEAVTLYSAVRRLRLDAGLTVTEVQKQPYHDHLKALKFELSRTTYDDSLERGQQMSLESAIEFALTEARINQEEDEIVHLQDTQSSFL